MQISANHNNQLFCLLAYDCDLQNKRLQLLFQENDANWDEIGLQILKTMSEERPGPSLDEYVIHEKKTRTKLGTD